MKIISLNTWSAVLDGPLYDFLRSYQETDVFCLQEVYKDALQKEEHKHPRLTLEYELYERIEGILGATHTGYFHPAYKDYYGQALFVHKEHRVLEAGDVFIYENESPEDRGFHSRNLQYVVIEREASPLLIANVHGLWNGKGKSDTEDRLEQSRRIKSFLTTRSEPVVLMGDFNLSPDTESLRIAGEGLRDLIREYGITSTRTSHYEKENKFADYAFVSDELTVKDFKVLPEEVSDHAALYLEVA